MQSCNVKRTEIQNEKLDVLVVAGGHSFDTSQFVDLFLSMESISFDTLMQPNANKLITENRCDNYDVFVFYDMWGEIDSAAIEGYTRLLKDGRGFVFLHHSLCSYQHWDEFKDVIGGRYFTEWSGVHDSLLSNYTHDIDIKVNVVDGEHPITRGMNNFIIFDEGYGNVHVNSDVKTILTTEHPNCSGALAWLNTYENSKIVYIMLGHDSHAYKHDQFKAILENAIGFVSI